MHAHESLWLQLFGMGLLWTTLHCSGMCGPIITGLLVHNDRGAPDATATQKTWPRIRGVLAYQSGRAITYAVLGGVAGALGASFEATIRPIANVGALVAAAIMVILAGVKLFGERYESFAAGSWASIGKRLGGLMRRLDGVAPERGARRMGVFGLLMGLMPCMLMFWVLGLSIASGSILTGAALMVGLVVMTTPMMLGVACSTSLLGGALKRWSTHIVPAALLLSAGWMLLIAAGANGLIPHAHLPLRFGGEIYTIMFW